MIKIIALILAAGYATRLHPLTENTPKPLLKVAGKPMVEHIIGKLEQIKSLNKIYIITNDKFQTHFTEWLHSFNAQKSIEIINDGTKSNDDKLGAIGDIHFAVSQKNVEEDVIVVAGDNLFEFHLDEVLGFYNKSKSNVIVLHDVKDLEMAEFVSLVHTVFNLGLNETWEFNDSEYRSFKSIDEWCTHISKFGFTDSGGRILQDNDPSDNTLVLLIKN